MRTLLLIVSIFLVGSISAQNWELFKAGQTYNFNSADIHGVRVDSVQTTQNDTTFYFNRILNDTVYRNYYIPNYPILDITQPNIFGNSARKTNDSIIFKNQYGNFMYLKPKASLNADWDFIDVDTLRIKAIVDSIYVDTVKNTIDSIKIISFQCYDSSNNPINHNINSQILLISKSNGILKSINLYENAVGNSININYKKNYSRVFQNIFYTKGEAYNLDIGDEYHFNYHNNPPGSPPGYNNTTHKVINKTTSANNDTITLTISENNETKTGKVNYTTSPPSINYTYSYSSKTLTKKIIHPNESLDSTIGFEPIVTIDTSCTFCNTKLASITGYSFNLPYSQSTYNNRIVISPEKLLFHFDTMHSSWMSNIYGPGFTKHILIGVFSFYNNWNNSNGGAGYAEYHSLYYFKKGNETWGTPIIITGLNQLENMEQAEELSIYPNPAKNRISITTKQEFKQLDYQVRSIKGQLIDTGQLNPNSSLNTSHLADGIYFLLLQSENFKETKKLIIQR